MMNILLILLGKTLAWVSRISNQGSGSTWPGHIALQVNPHFIQDMLKNTKTEVIIVVGTNGKTTTARMIASILEKNGKHIFHNTSGANLINGIASSLIFAANPVGRVTADYAIFEVDENSLPKVLAQITPSVIVVLNLFRDQLDRYGELDSIAKKWETAFTQLGDNTTLVLNADDPLVAYLGHGQKHAISYFGLEQKPNSNKMSHAADSIYCPRCNKKLTYASITYSHLGNWKCPSCHLSRPLTTKIHTIYPLVGTYNKYNTAAAVLCTTLLGLSSAAIQDALTGITPAFGRQEKISIDGKYIQLFLAKNPTSFNQSLETIASLNATTAVLILNDQIPDGRDVSWIWDIDVEQYAQKLTTIILSGDRVYDMAVRFQYANDLTKLTIEPNVQLAIAAGLAAIRSGETCYILPTYSAMLTVRKIITGKKIL